MKNVSLNYQKMLFTVFCFFLICLGVSAQTKQALADLPFQGSAALGYSHIYNTELTAGEQLSGNLVRADVVLKYRRLLFETDYQQMFFNGGTSHFFHNSLGYGLYSGKRMPDLYVLASHVHANEFPVNGLIYNQDHAGFGLGTMIRMKVETLLNADASFALTYFPWEQIFYKNMQVGWEIKYIGISIGGIGVRVPGGRLYSGFTFSVRYKWSVEGQNKSSSDKH